MDHMIVDSDEDENIAIIEAQRAPTSPPRKKRRLNNNQQQIQNHNSSESDYSTDSTETEQKSPSSPSDKENSANRVNRRKRRRPSSSSQQVISIQRPRGQNHAYSSQRANNSQQAIYQFGSFKSNIPIEVNPGAIVRVELINFLCHSNFSIALHPCVNIIYGQNGSGKSAIEAGISMALGVNAKKTGRGKNIKDVIKTGKDFAKIKIFLYNQGTEALPGYGPEIVIERKLTTNGKNGSSTFAVYDANLKKKGAGVKCVRDICDRLNINVENPCVILKQTTAKEFLNSTKSTDKFKFFMQASKLGDYEQNLNEARENVMVAKEQQKNTKGSFHQIKQQYFECKSQYDALLHTEEQQRMIEQWGVALKWMKFHGERDKLVKYQKAVQQTANKVIVGRQQLEQSRENLKVEIEQMAKLKDEIQEKTAETEQFAAPINELRKKQATLDAERKTMTRTASSKQKFVDKSRKKIRDYQRSYNQYMQQLQNDERGRKLAQLQQKLNESMEKLTQYRTQREPLQTQIEKTIEMKDQENKLNEQKRAIYHKENEIKGIKQQLKQIGSTRNRAELFNSRIAQMKKISVQEIRQEIQRYHRNFRRLPIGPLGEYIQVKQQKDQQTTNKHIQIVQSVLKDSLQSFLCDTSEDQQLFKKILWKRWKIVVPCIQFSYNDRPFNLTANAFIGYRPRDADGPLIRVTDMFTIKDNNPWVFNAIITNSNPERVYAHGDLRVARSFVSQLDHSKLHQINYIITYQEPRDKYFRVSKRGSTIQGQPIQKMSPILQADTSQLKQWYSQQLNAKTNERVSLCQGIQTLERFVRQNDIQIKENQKRFEGLNRAIKQCEINIERLNRQKQEIEEEEEDNNGIQQAMTELQNSIEDEKSQIQTLEEEIAPFQEQERLKCQEIADVKRELHAIVQKLNDKKCSVGLLEQKYRKMCETLTRKKRAIQKIPEKIKQYEQEQKENQATFDREQETVNKLHEEAKEAGDEVLPENYPKNPRQRNRPFSIKDLQAIKRSLATQIEAWRSAASPPEDIKRQFESIKPKYETHQERVDKCNLHVDEMNRLLHHRKREMNYMRDDVKLQLSQEFRLIMRKQGHDGRLEIDYEKGVLEMKVRMATHEESTQVVNSKTLSGGERSFAQIALIVALQKFSGSPMCIYDEFDVFMDSVNRGNSIKILLGAALGFDPNKPFNKDTPPKPTERQYIFITPNDVAPMLSQGHKNMMRIHKLQPPRR